MKEIFASFTANTQKQLHEQAEKHAMEIAEMKQKNIDTQNLLTTKTTPTQTINDHRTSAHFTKILFDVKPENWPKFEHHLLNATENPIIAWNQELMHFQSEDDMMKPLNFLKGYFDIPDTTIRALQDDLQQAKQIDLVRPESQLYKLHCLKTKLKNCLPDLAHDIETSMPTDISNKDGRIFFIKIISHTFPYKEARKRIIYESSMSISSN
jgi:hypothetical protein